MEISVVVPTLNSRERLAACLDALAAEAPAEILVVNGPSADGTSGMCRDRPDVDVLIELDDRNVNVARNAGLDRARGDVVAFVSQDLAVEAGWRDAVAAALPAADAITGPVRRHLEVGWTADEDDRRKVGGRAVRYLNGGNMAFTRAALEAIDGFDEHLVVGGARDASHRLAALDRVVEWVPEMAVAQRSDRSDVQPSVLADGGDGHDWGWRYHSLAYRLAKNYGIRPAVAYRVTRHAVADGIGTAKDVLRGEGLPSRWFADGRDVAIGGLRGLYEGVRARWRDRSPRRNPNGWSARSDRAVAVDDCRESV
ncbi:glycosyltransferase family 2 protein [Halosegnis sp.]|uniref:glycosyltransferase family 2 protein n=1 Tax=Halosegnis sp. TaxID=2864959 RepID=UPI0035D51ADA